MTKNSERDDGDKIEDDHIQLMNHRNKLASSSAFKNYFVLWVIRMLVCYMLYLHTSFEEEDVVESQKPPQMSCIRYIVGIVTHILVQENITSGFSFMKFALNHPWKFTSYRKAVMAGFLNVVIAVTVEVTIFYILFFGSDTIFDVLANYAIVLVIVDFDSNFYSIEGAHRLKSLANDEKYERIWKVEVTTSSSAQDQVPGNLLPAEKILPKDEAHRRPDHVYMSFTWRSFDNKILYLFYRLLVLVNNSIWYYFAPILINQLLNILLVFMNRDILVAGEESG